jgi:N-sulfoglucosamine sulfohydrolase
MSKRLLNILYLHCHDLGRYLQPYGYAVPTPNLQAMAERATLLRNLHTAAPTCSPSRACMLTGTHAHECLLGLAHRGFALHEPDRHLARYLAARGFNTALAGIQHEVAHDREAELYHEILRGPEYGNEGDDQGEYFLTQDCNVARAAADFLRRQHTRPFFLSCGFFLPHREFPQRARHNPNTVRPPEPLADTPSNRADWARYMTAAEGMDRAAGIVLDALQSSGRAADTIVLFTTDHGPAFPEMKCRLSDFGTHVAGIIDFPGNPARGRAIDVMLSQLDIFPTLAELAGFDKPDWLRGTSLLPVLEGTRDHLHDAIFAQVNYHAAYEPMRSIRTDRYKLIQLVDPDTRPVLPNCDNSPSKDFWFNTAGMRGQIQPTVQLFDLYRDPMERHNLAHDPGHAAVRQQLEAALRAHQQATCDPALAGIVPPPQTAVVTPRDVWSPDGRR